MKSWITRLASLKLTVVLVLLLAVVLSSGTILESLRGSEAARAVYGAGWFYALLAAFALNAVAALVERWPKDRWRIGFAITHVALLVILFGALATYGLKLEGHMPIPEGQQTGMMVRDAGDSQQAYRLPFELRLQSFEIDTYPGTHQPAQFRSRVVVVDRLAGGERPAVIEMNKPLSYGGYTFFQSSYSLEGGVRQTILSVSRDPGQPIVFIGYTLLVAGMIVVFATRLLQARRVARLPLAAMAALLLGFLAPAPSDAAPLPDRSSFAGLPDAALVESLRGLPVQDDGRTMPLDTQARNDVWAVTRGRGFRGIDPVALVLGWTFEPQMWSQQPMVRLRGDVADEIGLPAGSRDLSFSALVSNPRFFETVRAAHERQEAGGGKPSGLDRHLLELEERLVTLDGYFSGKALHAQPQQDLKDAWGPVRPGSAQELVDVAAKIRAANPAAFPEAQAIPREITYNRARPSRLAWVLLAAAALALAIGGERRWVSILAGASFALGFAAMTWGLALRWMVAGRIPASNMYESMLFLGWGVGLFGVLAIALRTRLLLANAAGLSAVAMMLVDLLPMDPFIHPMPPVLSGTPWLAIHVPIVMVSYSVYALATVLGHMVIGALIFSPARRDLVKRWSQLLYWYLHVGSILLIAGILTGSIWAASSWGRYWGWDPKEVWSLVAFLAYMAILHARSEGMVVEFGVAAGSIAAFWTILMTYLGVNYVLAAGLHSYGFGSSGLVRIMGAIALLEAAFLGAGWRAVRRRLPARAIGLPVLAR